MSKARISACLLSLILVLCLAAGAVADAAVSGTFEGAGSGKGGDIRVSVVLEDGKLSSITVLESNESKIIDEAMDILAARMVAGNTVDVDSVAGATLTSAGFKLAVRNALKEAGVEAKDLAPVAVEHTPVAIEGTYDVVIVGAGGAGLTAAVTAREAGASVAIVEKLQMAAGSTLLSGA